MSSKKEKAVKADHSAKQDINENKIEQEKYNEFQPHNVKKEALGPNTRR